MGQKKEAALVAIVKARRLQMKWNCLNAVSLATSQREAWRSVMTSSAGLSSDFLKPGVGCEKGNKSSKAALRVV
jgi:hypothetical protein